MLRKNIGKFWNQAKHSRHFVKARQPSTKVLLRKLQQRTRLSTSKQYYDGIIGDNAMQCIAMGHVKN